MNDEEEALWLSNNITEVETNAIIRKKTHLFQAHTVSKTLGNPKINSNVKEILEEVNYGTLNFGI